MLVVTLLAAMLACALGPAAAEQPAQRWCTEIKRVVDDRIAAAGRELQKSPPDALHLKVQEHKQEASANDDISDADMIKELEANLQAVQLMKMLTPVGTEEWKAMTALEDRILEKIAEAKKDAKRGAGVAQLANLGAAKETMLRRSRRSDTGTFGLLLGAGLGDLKRAEEELAALFARREADQALSSTVRDLCQSVEGGSATAAVVPGNASQACVPTAAERLAVALEVGLSQDCPTMVKRAGDSKKLATQALTSASQSAADLAMLLGVNASLPAGAEGSAVSSEASADEDLFNQAKQQLQALVAPFAALGKKGEAALEADQGLVKKLAESQAAASKSARSAEKCQKH